MHGFPKQTGNGEQIFYDLDNDGIPNCEDPDDDGDEIRDTEDGYPHDHDNDGIPDFKDDDDDNDGILDEEDDYYVGNCTKHVRNKLDMMQRTDFENRNNSGNWCRKR